jgi:hypothetical protein
MKTKRNFIVPVILIAICVVVIGIFAVPYIKTYFDVDNARNDARLESKSKFVTKNRALRSTGLLKKNYGYTTTDHCSLGTTEAGWMIKSWVQHCSIMRATAYETDASKLDIAKLIYFVSSKMNTLSELEYDISKNECTVAKAGYTYKQKTERIRIFYIPANRDVSGLECEKEIAVATKTQVDGIKDLNEFKYTETIDTSLIDKSKNQVWVIQTYNYYSKDIGCGLGLFCEEPIFVPINKP